VFKGLKYYSHVFLFLTYLPNTVTLSSVRYDMLYLLHGINV
jgi:hypothetical protein